MDYLILVINIFHFRWIEASSEGVMESARYDYAMRAFRLSSLYNYVEMVVPHAARYANPWSTAASAFKMDEPAAPMTARIL